MMRIEPNPTMARTFALLCAAGLAMLAGCDDDATTPDTTAPGQIEDLAVAAVSDSFVTLTWTATGDDSGEGRASLYELRYSIEPALEPDWLESQTGPYWDVPVPKVAGTPETLRFPALHQTSNYYFVLRAGDEVPNWSAFSSVCACTLRTPGPPTACFEVTNEPEEVGLPFDFDASCSSDPNDSDHMLTYRWDWENDGTFDYVALGDPIARHTFPTAGIYDVMLAVENSDAMRDTLIQKISQASLLPQHSVAETLEKLRYAYAYRDVVLIDSLLAPDFVFEFSDLDQANPYIPSDDISRSEEIGIHEAWFSPAFCQSLVLGFDYDMGTLEIDEVYSTPDDTLWTIRITNTDLFFYGSTPLHPDEPEGYDVLNGVSVFWFRREWDQGPHGEPTYSIVRWKELYFGGGKPPADVSWGQLKSVFR